METRAHHVVIGFFTLITVSTALLFALWLTKAGTEGQFKYFDVVFNETVSGLSLGSTVQYSGIKVGDVVQLKLDREDPSKVWARIRVNASTPVKQNTQAKLSINGITGTALIQLSSGSATSPLLQGRSETDIPVIIATPSPLNKLLSNSEDVMTNINVMLTRINRLLSQKNLSHIDSTLENLDLLSQTLAAQRGNVDTALQDLQQTLSLTRQIAEKSNILLSKQGEPILRDTAQTMQSLQKMAHTLESLLSKNHASIDHGLAGLNDLGPALDELRKTLTTLRTITQRLEDNPAAYILGQETSKEFTPR